MTVLNILMTTHTLTTWKFLKFPSVDSSLSYKGPSDPYVGHVIGRRSRNEDNQRLRQKVRGRQFRNYFGKY